MSHAYHLRPNAKGRIQRRLNAHVAAFGQQNKDKIVAVPSKTGQGVHLYFDPERSLSPDPDQTPEHQETDSTEEGVIVIDDESDGSGSADSSSGQASDLDTIAPDTPSPRSAFYPSSHLRAPKAPRLAKPAFWREGSLAASTSVHDSMALIAERRQQALNAHLGGHDCRRRHAEQEFQRQRKMLHQGEDGEQRVAELRREYEERVEEFRRENARIFGFEQGVDYYSSPPVSPSFFPPSLPPTPGPSRALRRQNAEQFPMPQQRDKSADSEADDGQFVVVARRVQKLGPCGTVVIDHETDEEMLVTKRYRVRAEELRSIDGDGDSVMGSDG